MSSGKGHLFCVLSAIFFIVSLICLTIYAFRSDGAQVKYYQNKLIWTGNKMDQKLAGVQLKYRISPTYDQSRLKDMFALDYQLNATKQDFDIAVNDFFSYAQSYYSTQDTAKQFPSFVFDDTNPDHPDSESFCLHLWWKPEQGYGMNQSLSDVWNQTKCTNSPAISKYQFYNASDNTGYNFPLWKKKVIQVEDCSNLTECSQDCAALNGSLSKNGTVCFTYSVLQRVCAAVDFIRTKDTYHLKSTGGCYFNRSAGYYEPAIPGHTYDFNSVEVQVRGQSDPYLALTSGNYHNSLAKDDTRGKGMKYFKAGVLSFGVSLLCLVLACIFYSRRAGDGEKRHLLPE